MTWIEVVDSAVKIGLGAIVAGLIAWRHDALTHKRNANKAYHEYAREILRQHVTLSEKYFMCQGEYLDALTTLANRKAAGTVPSQKLIELIGTLHDGVRERVKDMIASDAQLTTLQDAQVEKASKEYIQYINDFLVSIHDPITAQPSEDLRTDTVVLYVKQLQMRRTRFLLEIGEAIKRTFQ